MDVSNMSTGIDITSILIIVQIIEKSQHLVILILRTDVMAPTLNTIRYKKQRI